MCRSSVCLSVYLSGRHFLVLAWGHMSRAPPCRDLYVYVPVLRNQSSSTASNAASAGWPWQVTETCKDPVCWFCTLSCRQGAPIEGHPDVPMLHVILELWTGTRWTVGRSAMCDVVPCDTATRQRASIVLTYCSNAVLTSEIKQH